jgi:SAM-dependent methyltransferase
MVECLGSPNDEGALGTFEAMAPVYDDFTAGYDYEGWMTDVLALLEPHGLSGNRLLDVACGTGKSFLPMLARGWEVSACDISPAMIARAAANAPGLARLSVVDMRVLPRLGEFDLVWALDDAVNYLLSLTELEAAIGGMRENLVETGLLVFDVNELFAYRTFYAETSIREHGDFRFTWQGLGSPEVAAGAVSESRLEVVRIGQAADEPSEPDPGVSIHRQRHFSESEIRKALDRAGLACLDVFGHGLDGIPRRPLDPSIHTKGIYVAGRR